MEPSTSAVQDVASFDLGSTHRMPTLSAAQVLDDLGSNQSRYIPTGLVALDEALTPHTTLSREGASAMPRGLETSQVAEIWGPPGSGKTALALQLAANTLKSGHKVLWVDGFHRVGGQRLRTVCRAVESCSPTGSIDLDALHHFTASSFAHLVALLCKPTSNAVPEGTSLVVIDSFSALVNHAYPRTFDSKKPLKGPSSSSKRLQAIQFVVSSLQKLAAAKDLLVLIVSQCATKMQNDRGATIAPAVLSNALEAGLTTRLVVFRDWVGLQELSRSIHLVGIQKAHGTVVPEVIGQAFPFEITTDGVAGVQLDLSRDSYNLATTAYQKRKLDDTGFEVADSDDDAYGWDSGDESDMPRMPPQAQGSEDLLLGDNVNDENASDPEESDLSSLSSPEPLDEEG